MFCISRPSDIGLNGKEYLLTDHGNMMLFITVEEAQQFLVDNGIPADAVMIEPHLAD